MPRDTECSPQIAIEADLGGFRLGFVESTEGLTRDEILAHCDTYREVISIQRAHQALLEALVDLKARQEALESLPTRETEALAAIVTDKARQQAAFEAARNNGPRVARREFELNGQQRAALAQFDDKIAEKKREFAAEKLRLEKEIPVYLSQVSRQRAIIAGRDRAEVLSEAAD
jgi:hypothetical protein